MTGRELIKWVLDNNAENAEFEVQYRDSGGDYDGTDKDLYLVAETAKDKDGRSYKRVVL